MHIAIAGNIGSGKTTLTGLLSKHYGWDTHFEDVEQNPYLNEPEGDHYEETNSVGPNAVPRILDLATLLIEWVP